MTTATAIEATEMTATAKTYTAFEAAMDRLASGADHKRKLERDEAWRDEQDRAAKMNKILTDICNQLLDEDLTPKQIANLAADIPGECEAIRDARDEAAWDRHQESLTEGGPDNSSYRRDMIAAGRGHLLGD